MAGKSRSRSATAAAPRAGAKAAKAAPAADAKKPAPAKAAATKAAAANKPAATKAKTPDADSPRPMPHARPQDDTDVNKPDSDIQQESELNQFWVDEAMIKEEQAAALIRERAAAAALPKDKLDKKKLEVLDRLLNQAHMYSKFLTEQVKSLEPSIGEAGGVDDAAGDGKRKSSAGGGASSKRAKTGGAPAKSPTQQMLPLIEGELRSYQLKGVAWLISLWSNGMNGILADQMGLGKTVQTIGFLSHLVSKGVHGPFLIVAPLSTLPNWTREVARWCPSIEAILYHGTREERAELRAEHFKKYDRATGAVPRDFPVIVTSFEIAIRDRRALQALSYKYMVVDEGHRLKNSECLLVQELKLLDTANKLLLTGTPLQNNLAELWSLLNFLLPAIFNNLANFESWFDFSAMVGADDTENVSKEILESEAKNRMVSKLHEILKPFLLRRIKADVEHSLPSKQEIVLYAPMTPLQLRLQEKLVDKTLLQEAAENKKLNGGNASISKLNMLLMQLRKNCNHPDLITSEWEQSPSYPPAADLVDQCGKMQLLDRLLRSLKAKGHKVLIFSQFTRMLDLLDSYIDEMGWRTCRIDGSIGFRDRMASMDAFNSDPDHFVFLLSTRAGGLGINLTSADTVIIYDSDWNPHQDMQAMDRAHRIGQTRPVLVLRLCTSQSVEVKLLKRAHSKLALERLVIKKGAFAGAPAAAEADEDAKASLSAQELLDMLKVGDLQGEEALQSAAVSEAALDMLLDRSHLAARTDCPYPRSGPGYELVAQQESGLLSSVQ